MASGPHTVRIARTAPATLDHTFVIGEDPTAADGAVTVTVTDANGATVSTGTATADGANPGRYTYLLPGQADLATLTASWSAAFTAVTVVEADEVQVVGARHFTLADARASDTSLADPNRYSTADLEDARLVVELEVEQICDRAFTASYRRAVLDGTGSSRIMLTDAAWAQRDRSAGDIRRIVSASVAPRFGEDPVLLTDTQLAALYVTAGGEVCRTDGNVWTEGYGNVVIEYEYGFTSPPADLLGAEFLRLRDVLNQNKTGIPDRATSYSISDGGTYRLGQADTYKTGIPAVDGPYSRYSRRSDDEGGDGSGGRQSTASRTLTFDPQRASMFHGKGY